MRREDLDELFVQRAVALIEKEGPLTARMVLEKLVFDKNDKLMASYIRDVQVASRLMKFVGKDRLERKWIRNSIWGYRNGRRCSGFMYVFYIKGFDIDLWLENRLAYISGIREEPDVYRDPYEMSETFK